MSRNISPSVLQAIDFGQLVPSGLAVPSDLHAWTRFNIDHGQPVPSGMAVPSVGAAAPPLGFLSWKARKATPQTAPETLDAAKRRVRAATLAGLGNIPQELQVRPQWVLWLLKATDEPGHFSKAPLCASHASLASSTDPTTWSSFEETVESFHAGRGDGIGIVLSADSGLVGIDLDACFKNGAVSSDAQAIVDRFPNTYWERSPSGKGLRGFTLSSLPAGRKKKLGKVEVYTTGRFLTVTGDRLSTAGHDVAAVDPKQMLAWHESVFGKPENRIQRKPVAHNIGLQERIDAAIAFIIKRPPAVEGDAGDLKTYLTAQDIVRGFDLPEDDAFDVLWNHWNDRCDPPWNESDLMRKIVAAAKESPLAAVARGQYLQRAATRPVVLVTKEEHEVADEVIAALAKNPAVYQRAGSLVRVARPSVGAPTIQRIPRASMRETLTASASFRAIKKKKQTDEDEGAPAEVEGVPNDGDGTQAVHPPIWLADAVHARGDYKGVRPLVDIISTPTMRPDGTLLLDNGYDDTTGLLLASDLALPAIPDAPTLDDAKVAVASLLEVVADVPFQSDAARSTWLAGLLAVVGRSAIDGPVPLFLADANTRGAGKSLVCDLVGLIAQGQAMPRSTVSKDDSETRKKITALAIRGTPTVLLDNLHAPLGGEALDAALTSVTWVDRILGQSETVSLPLSLVWFATGNNTQVLGDTERRVLRMRIESPEERPEERTEFKHENIKGFVSENRGRLVASALTILRAYCVAGKPKTTATILGSFEAFSTLVSGALVWAGQADPALTMKEMREENGSSDAAQLGALIEVWTQLDPEGLGMTCVQATAALIMQPKLREIVLEICPTHNNEVDSKRLGYLLKSMRGRVSGNRRFAVKGRKNSGTVFFVDVVGVAK